MRDATWRYTLGLGVLLAIVALWAAPRSIQAGDAGEFATVMLAGGVPHPSGYPWMRILGMVARPLWALGVPPTLASSLPCAACGIAGWLLLQRVILKFAKPIVATACVAVIATAPLVVVHTTDCEVWGPLVLFVAIIIRLATATRVRPLWLGVALGVGISHHLTISLCLPICIVAAWPRGGNPKAVLIAGARGVAGTLVGLLAYLTLMIGTGPWSWGDTSGLSGLAHHVLRLDYGLTSLSLHAEAPPALDQLSRAGGSIGGALSAGLLSSPLLGGLFALVVIGAVARPAAGSLRKGDHLALLATTLLSGIGFVLMHNIDPSSPFGAWILERFDILTLVVLTPLLAVGVERAVDLVRTKIARVGLVAIGALLLARQLLLISWEGAPSQSDMIQTYARDLLRTPAPARKALIFGTDDHRLFGVLYTQTILGEGHNAVYIDASLLSQPWYRRHVRQRFPQLPDVDKPVRLMAAIWNDPELVDTPIYLANDFSRPSSTLPRVPEGILWRVLPPNELEIDADTTLRRHLDALGRYEPRRLEPQMARHPFASDLAAAYDVSTQALVAALRAGGRIEDAEAVARAADGLLLRGAP